MSSFCDLTLKFSLILAILVPMSISTPMPSWVEHEKSITTPGLDPAEPNPCPANKCQNANNQHLLARQMTSSRGLYLKTLLILAIPTPCCSLNVLLNRAEHEKKSYNLRALNHNLNLQLSIQFHRSAGITLSLFYYP